MTENNIKVFDFEDSKVRTVMLNNEPYFVGKDVASILGYKDVNRAVRQHVNKKDIKPLSHKAYGDSYTILWDNKNDFMDKVVINKSGVCSLIASSRQPEAIDLAKMLHLDIDYVLPTYKEQQTLSCIIESFGGLKMNRQYSIGKYRIDLYFPDYKIAIECDEFGHKDRNKIYEHNRQKYIEDKLGCTFIRYNPDEDDFSIFKVINTIFKNIERKQK